MSDLKPNKRPSRPWLDGDDPIDTPKPEWWVDDDDLDDDDLDEPKRRRRRPTKAALEYGEGDYTETRKQSFLAHIEFLGEDHKTCCWVDKRGPGSGPQAGYRQTSFKSQRMSTAGVAWNLWRGPYYGEKPTPRATCGTPGCLNPDHLGFPQVRTA